MSKDLVCLQALKESATELLFGGHETTASTATSLVMFLGLNPEAVDRLRQELMEEVPSSFHKHLLSSIQCSTRSIIGNRRTMNVPEVTPGPGPGQRGTSFGQIIEVPILMAHV